MGEKEKEKEEEQRKNRNFLFSILSTEMIRLWVLALQFSELFVSSVVHLLYGFYIFSSAVAGDLSQALNEMFFKPNMNVEVKELVPKESTTNVDDLPPIVLVHGIFGFGKGVLRLFSFLYLFFFSQMGFVLFFYHIIFWRVF